MGQAVQGPERVSLLQPFPHHRIRPGKGKALIGVAGPTPGVLSPALVVRATLPGLGKGLVLLGLQGAHLVTCRFCPASWLVGDASCRAALKSPELSGVPDAPMPTEEFLTTALHAH